MRYRILGPLQVAGARGLSAVSAPKVGRLLAALLIRADRIVSREELVRELWPADPPRRATAALHVHVSQLRKLLRRSGGGDPIGTEAPGYVLRTEPGELDLHVFQQRVGDGRRHARAQQHEDAARSLRSALAMCQSPPLPGLGGGPIADGFVRWFGDVRAECAEAAVESSIRLGRHHEATELLRSMLDAYPLREGFYRQLMLTMHRSGRRAEALAVYQHARRVIKQELGLEPCQALRDLERTVLSAGENGAPARAG
ncbi:AfsR/SARP family transcriptional regulator [Saccharopolyspora rosea]|uniref:BTAD domain-containing putative transcriptional regulator n=1 Tax=Saccharopolyspora rosea TaxID=524884 RepID=A0ABW3FUL5_9PSEU|nr:AfsR/SARP family transcriptional regulator [Saccharopolyspora rosea]